jgi:hypothetical protein
MSIPDQKKMGSFAAITLLKECEKLENGHIDSGPEPYPKCCRIARVYHLPCVHRLLSRNHRIPRLTICDVHVRWQLQDLRKDGEASHLTVDLDTTPEYRKPSPTQWNVSELVARFEPCFSIAKRSAECQKILNDALERLNNIFVAEQSPIESASSGDPARLLDPKCAKISGRPDAHPSHKSILSRQMGSSNHKRGSSLTGQPKRKRTYCCSVCKQMGHNAQTCKATLNES